MIDIKQLLDTFIESYPEIAFNEKEQGKTMTRIILLDEDRIDAILKYIYKLTIQSEVDTIVTWEEVETIASKEHGKQSLLIGIVRTKE